MCDGRTDIQTRCRSKDCAVLWVKSGICNIVSFFSLSLFFYISFSKIYFSVGYRWLMRGMATLPQGNQEPLMVRDKVETLQVSLG